MATPARPLLGWLIGMTVLSAIVMFFAFTPLLVSFMIFDAGETAEAWGTFIAIWTTPVVMFAALTCAWIAYAAGSHRATLILMIVAAIPLVLLGILAGFMLVGTMVD